MSEERKRRLSSDLAKFLRAYGRKGSVGGYPNDRGYDPKMVAKIKRMKPEELDALMREEEDEPESGEPSTLS